MRYDAFLDGSTVLRKVIKLADEHGTPNGFLAQEVATRFAPPGVVGRILRAEGAAEYLASYGFVLKRRNKGWSVDVIRSQ
jgi:hypothetical protein